MVPQLPWRDDEGRAQRQGALHDFDAGKWPEAVSRRHRLNRAMANQNAMALSGIESRKVELRSGRQNVDFEACGERIDRHPGTMHPHNDEAVPKAWREQAKPRHGRLGYEDHDVGCRGVTGTINFGSSTSGASHRFGRQGGCSCVALVPISGSGPCPRA